MRFPFKIAFIFVVSPFPMPPSKHHNRQHHQLNLLSRPRNSRTRSPTSRSSSQREMSPNLRSTTSSFGDTPSSQPALSYSRSPPDKDMEDADQTDNDNGAVTVHDANITQYLREKGRLIGRYCTMWRSFRPIMDMALLGNTNNLRSSQQELLNTYKSIVRIADLIPDIVREHESPSEIAKALEKARSGARSSDVSSMKEKMQHWRQFDPPINPSDRRTMGFHNMSSGALLCPATKDWNDSETRKGLENGTLQVAASDFPIFLWKNEKMNPSDPIDGFLRGEILVKAFLHIFIGPQAAYGVKGSRATRKGNAAAHDIVKVSSNAIAYAATVARFVLSDQETLVSGGKQKGQWPYEGFYNAITSMLDDLSYDDFNELIDWWNESIFGDVSFLEDDEMDDQDVPTAASLMRKQIKARQGARSSSPDNGK